MEFFLFIIILVLLITLINKTNSNYGNLKRSIDVLTKKMADLNSDEVKEKIKEPSSIVSIKQKPNKTEFEKDIEPIGPDIILEKNIVEKTLTPIEDTKPTPKLVTTNDKILDVNQKNLTEQVDKPKILTPPRKSYWEKFKDKNPDLEKFIGENLINKIGILILVLGISYFVKFAIDKNWINEPARIGIGILAGALVMGIAHKLRKNYGAFSSVLVAGAIAIFYFTIGIAFHDYQLFNQTVAFAIMVIITVFSSLISLSYNRMELAILSLIGGFAVPFMVSTGTGNYIVLFTYIIILNIGILGLAYYKKWNTVNILAFVFTVLLFGAWFFNDVNSDTPHYLGALLFAFAFYFIFIVTNIINNIRTKGTFSNAQLSILAINTFLFYGVGMLIFSNYRPELKGLFTTGLGFLNLIYAWLLYKKFGLDKTAVYLLIGLTLTFITLAIPIQFKGNYITLFWAAEAVLLMWLSQKSKIKSYRFAAVIVHVLMVLSLIMDWEQKYNNDVEVLNIIINPIFGTGIFAIISIFLVYFLLKNEKEKLKQWSLIFNPVSYRRNIFIVGIIIAYFVGIFETVYQALNYVDNSTTAFAIPAVYHLLFTAILSFVLYKKSTKSVHQLINVIAIFNIVLFVLGFSKLAFIEHLEYISSGSFQRIAYYLHFISLVLILYFGYLIYKTNKQKIVFEIFNKKMFIWITAIFVIIIASIEVMLHGLVILNAPITMQELQAHQLYETYNGEIDNFRAIISNDLIEETKLKIIKTGFPVLWGILAFLFLILGIKKQIQIVRIIALVLLGVTIVKLFLFDINNVSETGKIIAFILLGVLVLIISFVYQKIKVLVLDDDKPNKK